jgi:hypothetical protein
VGEGVEESGGVQKTSSRLLDFSTGRLNVYREEEPMNISRLETWTRRSFSLVVGASLATLATEARRPAAAKKRKKRKTCDPCPECLLPMNVCAPTGTARCCGGLTCGVPYPLQTGNSTDTRCCYGEGYSPCYTEYDCCYPAFCSGPGGQCVVNSDRNLKGNFASVDPADLLARVAALPIASWNYIGDDPSVRHIGPVAQDFAAAFGVGSDDRHIHPVDGQGVALAAIQGLLAEVERLRQENAALARRLDAIERA